jgi:hypothetical protein
LKSIVHAAAACAFAVAAGAASAQYATIEEAAAVTADNVTRFETDSVALQGSARRFDITVAWRDGFVRPEGAPPRKIVRYLVKCEGREIALASVAVYGPGGSTAKIYGIAPGGWDFAPVAQGSTEAQWLAKACAATP